MCGSGLVGIVLGNFITLLIRGMGLLEFPGLGFMGHYDQG